MNPPDHLTRRLVARASTSARLLAAVRGVARNLEETRSRGALLLGEVARLRARNEELERLNQRLARLSVTDELTGLPNHRAFRDSLSREIKRALRDESALALVLFDVDDFKRLNDTHGHAVGDAILSRIAKVMRGALREVDLLARYGGEEFALLAPGASLGGAVAIAEKIRLAVSQASFSVITLEGKRELRVSVSAGVALFSGCEQRLFNDADRALYAAKHAGKDCVQTAD